jgi:hypothetical protein
MMTLARKSNVSQDAANVFLTYEAALDISCAVDIRLTSFECRNAAVWIAHHQTPKSQGDTFGATRSRAAFNAARPRPSRRIAALSARDSPPRCTFMATMLKWQLHDRKIRPIHHPEFARAAQVVEAPEPVLPQRDPVVRSDIE